MIDIRIFKDLFFFLDKIIDKQCHKERLYATIFFYKKLCDFLISLFVQNESFLYIQLFCVLINKISFIIRINIAA